MKKQKKTRRRGRKKRVKKGNFRHLGMIAAALPLFFFFIYLARNSLHYELPLLTDILEPQKPVFLTFEELKVLSENPHRGGVLEEKLQKFWTTPLISNEAYFQGARPRRLSDPRLGSYMTVASWNIEKSLNIQEAVSAFTSEPAYEQLVDDRKAPAGSALRRAALEQRDKLSRADIVLVQEMDIGVKRSGYVDAARELAQASHMNYAYAPEYLEIDPVSLGLEKVYLEDGQDDSEAILYYKEDPSRYRGVFGSAVLSRYRIKNAQVFPLKNQPYDWYGKEKRKIGFLERARRIGTKTVFKNELTREMKVGGRNFFRVDLEVPELPGGTLTVINVHLEIKCQPEDRAKQMAEILDYIRRIRHPVIVAGDLNSAPADLSATSLWRVTARTAKSPETWFSVLTSMVMPYALAVNASRTAANITKNMQDPFAPDIPFAAPNRLRKLFGMIQSFRFEDGGRFDLRGDARRSLSGRAGILSNSNQRDLKGFKTTFSVRRPLGPVIGKYRLDWIFVKIPDKNYMSHFYSRSPHFGETLEAMNTCLKRPISDHHPNVVDIPFGEPKI